MDDEQFNKMLDELSVVLQSLESIYSILEKLAYERE